MKINSKYRIRNAEKARNSFVTKRAEGKLSALADLFKAASGKCWDETKLRTLQRDISFSGYNYLNELRLVYNWENRFMSVNYNLQIISDFYTDTEQFENTGNCLFSLNCRQKGMKGKRTYSWDCKKWNDDKEKLSKYIERLNNPLITERLDALDIMEMEIHYRADWGLWRISCESIIGSAVWMLIPPVVSMVTPKLEECVRVLELYELLGDAVVNNK